MPNSEAISLAVEFPLKAAKATFAFRSLLNFFRFIVSSSDQCDTTLAHCLIYGIHYILANQFAKLEEEKAPTERQVKNRRAFKLISINDVLQKADKPIDWLIDKFIEVGSLNFGYGDPDSFKSFIKTISMAASVATGTPWYDYPVKQSPVIIIAGEGSRGLGRRLAAWSKKWGIPLENAPLTISSSPAQILDDKSYEIVCNEVDASSSRFGDPGLIIIDTLTRNQGAGNQNSSEDMARVINRIDAIHSDAAKIIIHHTGHGNKNRMMGSMALPGAADSHFLFRKLDGNQPLSRVEMKCKKMKDADKSPLMIFQPEKINLGFGEGGVEINSLAMEYVSGQVPDGIFDLDESKIFELLTEGKTQKQVSEALGLNQKKIERIVREAKEKGFIKNVGSNAKPVWILTKGDKR